MITIDRSGTMGGFDRSDKAALERCAGTWRIGAATPGVVLLTREDSKTIPLMAGCIMPDGWIVDVVANVSASRLSGALCTQSNGVLRELYFDRGGLRMANSTAHSDLLGEFLVAQNAISREQLDAALAQSVQGRKLGETLVSQGALSGPDVYWLLLRKIEKVFTDVLALRDGSYWFLGGVDLSRLPASLFLDTQALLMEGVRRIDELDYCRHTIPIASARLRQEPSLARGCSDLEQRFLAQVDGTKTVIAIEQELQLGLHEAARAMNGLRTLGLVDSIAVEDVDSNAAAIIVSGFNRALTIIYQAALKAGFESELVRLACEFPQHGKHGNRKLALVNLRADGLLDESAVRELIDGAEETDKIKFAIVLLTQYISFVLFTANSRLGPDEQQRLSADANAALSEAYASYL